MAASLFPCASAAVLAGAAYAYGIVSGSTLDSLLLLGALTLQDRERVSLWLASALSTAKCSQTLALVAGLVTLAALAAAFKPGPRQQAVGQLAAQSGPWTGPGKPLLFPCITTHVRLVPKKHSFVYSYLVVGVPVGWAGVCNSMVSVAGAGRQRGWYHIDAAEYLERGSGHSGLRGKLDAHLVSQGADPAQYPHAYLVTAGKFWGYSFNPVSFWYLYDASKTLAAMVLEVNNTFGERHMYFLLRTSGGEEKGSEALFRQTWPKEFHVSPFNSRKGSYELVANDPLAPSMQGIGPISATILLRSSHTQSKVVGRLLSERCDDGKGGTVAAPALDPAAMTLWHKAKFLASWWWVGFATLPRIIKHAGILFLRKRLHVWFRPEPLATSTSRLADAPERDLEAVFRLYLRHLVENVADNDDTGQPLAVRYIPCGIPKARPELMLSPAAQSCSPQREAKGSVTAANTAGVGEMEFRVLTPVFYARFVHYAHDVEALFCELRESGTISIAPEAAAALFAKRLLSKQAPPPPLQVSSPIEFLLFKAIQTLRQRPDPIQRPMIWPTGKNSARPSPASRTNERPTTVSKDLRGFRLSAMDGFVLGLGNGPGDRRMRQSYRSTVLLLFLADRVSFGSVPVLKLQWLVLRVVMAWFLARGVLNAVVILSMFKWTPLALPF